MATQVRQLEATLDHAALRQAAARALSYTPRPFLRWAGSKRALLASIIDVLPNNFGTYFEPFLGSGSLFFLLHPENAVLSDACSELVDVYSAVRDNPSAIAAYLRNWKPDREFFYAMRDNRSAGRLKRAAEFIYLNRTCWNGLYRVNSKGKFNVPYGAPKTDFLVDERNLSECAKALRTPGVQILWGDFEDSLSTVRFGDLVFLDPPYVTGHNNNGFIDYNETLFSWSDQERLARRAHALRARGAHVIVTNAYHSDVLDLYAGFRIAPLERPSTLAGDIARRRVVREAVIWSCDG